MTAKKRLSLPEAGVYLIYLGFVIPLITLGTGDIRLAGVFSGLVFRTKYSGVFLLPLIVLCLLLPEDGVLRPSAAIRRLKTVRIWLLLLGVPAIFCVTVAITNPYMVLAFDAFRESLMIEKGIMGFGHSFRVETSCAEWLYMLWGLMGSVHGAVLLVTLTVCVLSVKREGRVPAAPGCFCCGWLYSLRI